MNTLHYDAERIEREKIIEKIGLGTKIATFEVDRNHKNGIELHTITSTGIIIIQNKRTQKIITKLIARPGQIERYFDKKTETVIELMKIAREHQKAGYNYK